MATYSHVEDATTKVWNILQSFGIRVSMKVFGDCGVYTLFHYREFFDSVLSYKESGLSVFMLVSRWRLGKLHGPNYVQLRPLASAFDILGIHFLPCQWLHIRLSIPQFCAIFQSIQTCRNVGRFIPNHLDVMSLCLGCWKWQILEWPLLRDWSGEIGWIYIGDFTWKWKDCRFHLFLTSLKHIYQLLLESCPTWRAS